MRKRSGTASTILDLLLSFYAPDRGTILINGIDASRIDSRDIRNRILLVAQDTAIFNDTVANNLRLGLDASQSVIERACRIA